MDKKKYRDEKSKIVRRIGFLQMRPPAPKAEVVAAEQKLKTLMSLKDSTDEGKINEFFSK